MDTTIASTHRTTSADPYRDVHPTFSDVDPGSDAGTTPGASSTTISGTDAAAHSGANRHVRSRPVMAYADPKPSTAAAAAGLQGKELTFCMSFVLIIQSSCIWCGMEM
ncbi:hypothetical protein OPV22_008117 [Ensete ventricosum]|uniref:SMP domain-containing protein n=1 Tax=Ensete ventricosum TaxID=4639 RepID=A0AAV8R800_ENSVE|nr:hypothetical protein OPV22_008117 [Ensete ventricosum]